MKRKIPKKYQKGGVASTNPKPITKNRKKHARSIRKGVGNVLPDGKTETHRMATYTGENKKVTYAAPTITFDKDGNKKPQSFQQALEAGEVYEFKNKKRADKFAFGSWKKSKDKRKAMKSYRKKMQTGGAPPTLQSRLENSWRAELGEIDDLVASGLGDMSPQAQAKMMERQGSLRGQLGLNKYGQPENKNTWTEGVKSDDWTFNTGGDRASSWEPGVQTFTYDPQKEKRKTDRAYRRANQQDTSTIYTGEGDDLNPELEGGGFNKEAMSDPDSGLSKGIGAVAGLTGTYFDKLAGEDYAAREKKRDEAVANVESVEGLSPLHLENQRAMARKKGQQDIVEGYDYVGHGAKSGAVKGAGMGAQVAGPWGALVGAAIGGIGGGLMGKSKSEDARFAAAEQATKDRKRLQGMQADELSEIDPTKDEYSTVAAVTVKKGGKIKKQAGGLIKGPGTGTSDDIPGNLNEGDFVATEKNKNKALNLRKQFGLPMQKANLQKGGKAMKKIPVKVSNGETLFTKKEIASMVKRGGGQVVDYLNSLAPEAEVPLKKGGDPDKEKKYSKGEAYYSVPKWIEPTSKVVTQSTKAGQPGFIVPKEIDIKTLMGVRENIKRIQSLYPEGINVSQEQLEKTGLRDIYNQSNLWLEGYNKYVDPEQEYRGRLGGTEEGLDTVLTSQIIGSRHREQPLGVPKRKGGKIALQKGGAATSDEEIQKALNELEKATEYRRKLREELLASKPKREHEQSLKKGRLKLIGEIDWEEKKLVQALATIRNSSKYMREGKNLTAGADHRLKNALKQVKESQKKLTDSNERLNSPKWNSDNYEYKKLTKEGAIYGTTYETKEYVYNPELAKKNAQKSKTDKLTSEKTSGFELPFDPLAGTPFKTKPLKPGQAVVKIPPKDSGKDSKKQKVTPARVGTTGTTGTTGAAVPAVATTEKPKELEVGLYTDEEGNVFEKGRTGKWRWKSNKAIEEGVPEYGEVPIDLDEEWQEGDIEVDESVLTPYTPPQSIEEEVVEEGDGEEEEDKVTEETEREFPWSDLAGSLQAGMGLKGLAAMGQRPKGVKSADLLAQQRRIDAAQSQFNIPIDETLRDIERTRRASIIPTTGERGYEFAKRSAATGQAMSNIQKARERKAILEGEAKERFNLSKLGMQGQMATALAGEDRMLFQDDMQAFQQKQGAYAQLLQAGIANFLKGKEARATRRSLKDIEGDVTVNIGN